MNQDNRVLGRKGARELTEQEIEYATGAIRTTSLCTINVLGGRDGDNFPGEC